MVETVDFRNAVGGEGKDALATAGGTSALL
jgi:hypothetical protein